MPTQKSNTFTLGRKWQETLSDLVIEAEQLAQSSQRTRKMSVEQLVQTLVLGCLEPEAVSLRLWSEVAAELGCEITPSSLDERLTKRTVMLLYEVLQASIKHQVCVSDLPVEHLKTLSRLVLYDSTGLTLPPILKHAFRASRETGLGHMKVQVGYDYLNGQLQSLSINEGIAPDQRDAGLLQQAVEQALLIFDLGYFDQETLAAITEQNAYFVTRYQSQTALYDLMTGETVDLVKQLQSTQVDCFEAHYHLGLNAKLPVRLVARRVAAQEAEKRRRRVKREAQKGRYTASKRSLMLCDWEIVISNLPTMWTAQQILDLYRVRWQIELLFKAWKSYLDVAVFGYWRAERVLCQLFASLIGAVLCQTSFAIVRFNTHEASLFKTVRMIRRQVIHLFKIIRHNWRGLYGWARNLYQVLLKFAQQQNLETAPSTLRRLINWGLT